MSWQGIQRRQGLYYAMLFLLEAALIGVFAAQDLFLFYTFYELTLVPIVMMIGVWGGERRIYAAIKFFVYTLVASVLMLSSIMYLYVQTGSGQIDVLARLSEDGRSLFQSDVANWLFLGFFAAFAVKLALVPFHTWLPDAYDEAPPAGPMLMSALLMKMGTYGLLRIALPLFPLQARQNASWIVLLAIVTILYGALLALIQPNLRRLVGYSSISHVGFIVLGIFTLTQAGLDGSVFQMVAHGVSTGAMFVLLGFLEERRRSMEIADFGGVAQIAPGMAVAVFFVGMASIGLPGLSNFVGEFLVLQGAAQVYFPWSAYAAAGVVLSACYFLWMYQRVFLGERPAKSGPFSDLSPREWLVVLPLVGMILYLGIGSNSLLPAISGVTQRIVEATKAGVEYRVELGQHQGATDAD
jgi:NADH-quinone oxidoreductase subunit M